MFGFLSVDPLTSSYPMLTPYQFASNSPISGIDLDGLEYANATTGQGLGPLSQQSLNSTKITIVDSRTVDSETVVGYLPEVSISASRLPKPTAGATPVSNPVATNSQPSNSHSPKLGASASMASAVSSALAFQGYNLFDGSTWRGANGSRYAIDAAPGNARPFYGNQYTGSRSSVLKSASMAKAAGNIIGGAGAIFSEVAFTSALSDESLGPNMRAHLEYRRNASRVISAVSFAGPEGAAIGAGFSIGELFEAAFGVNIQYNPIEGNFRPIEETFTEYDRMGIDLSKLGPKNDN